MMMRYITPTMAHTSKARMVLATTFLAVLTSSGKPMTDYMEVSFRVMMNWLMMLGIMVRMAWGSTTFAMARQ